MSQVTRSITAPFGSWRSPITAATVASRTVGLREARIDGDSVYWLETRPTEGGRTVVVGKSRTTEPQDVTATPFNARTRVHEYGGGSYLVSDGTVYFSNFGDQRLYRMAPDEEPIAVTPEAKLRFADGTMDPVRGRIVCVREDHSNPIVGPINSLVALDPSGLHVDQGGRILAIGNDFYSSPTLSPDGRRLAWLTWHHPNMPWDGTELWVGTFAPDGSLVDTECVAGGPNESVFQPEWSPNGTLYYVSDRSGWWNLHRRQGGDNECVLEMEAEFGRPQWVFGQSTYAFISAQRIVCTYTRSGWWRLAYLHLETGVLEDIPIPYTEIASVRAQGRRVVFVAAGPTEPAAVVELDVDTGATEVLRQSTTESVDPGYVSEPEPIEFDTEGSLTAHGLYYAPKNKDYSGPPGELPPLLVISHGGPTGATSSSLRLGTQYWTSRGIAILDVNYGGSTGYGRPFRDRLKGQWGVVDVDDCVHGALHLAERGLVDGDRLMIRGGSAGGYTTLCALTFRDVFKAGASYFGVSDLASLTTETHKFESRYLDQLVGPYPERADVYAARSPINAADQISRPVIFFQGLEDRVVPPNQAELMVEALGSRGIPVAYLPFEGEQHGFRQAKHMIRSLEAELYFYSRVFKFDLAEPVDPIMIENADRLG
jgi:dipeptidyl aminopeptidase/acylaminoacyl peptidase